MFVMPDILLRGLWATLALCTFLLPVLIVLFLKNRKLITSIEIEEQDERTLPFFSTACSFALGYYLLIKLHIPLVFSTMLIAASISTFLALLINFRYKISIHMIGMGSIAGILWALGQRWVIDLHLPLVFIILMAGLVGSARITLNAHNPGQVYSGFILGFITSSVLFMV
jgi:membrane-associated phospholipid phosphatase